MGRISPTKRQIAVAARLLGKALFTIERAQCSAAMRACDFVDQSSINSGKNKIMAQHQALEDALAERGA